MKANSITIRQFLSILLFFYFFFTSGSFSAQIIPSNFSNLNQVVAFIMLLIFMYFSWSSSFKFRLDNVSIFYFIFVLFVCVSVTWSDSDFQKYFRMFLFLATTSFAFFLSRQFPSEFIFTCLLKVMLSLSIISLLLVFFKPSIGISTLTHEGAWSGVFDQKNSLGRCFTMVVFISFIFSFFAHKFKFFILTVLFLFFTNFTDSRTSIYLSFIIFFLAFIIRNNSLFLSSRFNRLFVIVFTIFLLSWFFISPSVYLGNVSSANDYINFFGVEIPLTGRATIWSFSIHSIFTDGNYILGYGYDGFWGTSNSVMYKWGMGDFEANDSHNGFIDLFLQVGWVGLIFFLGILVFCLYKFLGFNKSKHQNELYFLVMVLIFFTLFNLTESTLLKSTNFMQFIFSYSIFRGALLLSKS